MLISALGAETSAASAAAGRAAISFATRRASWRTPPTSIDAKRVRNGAPTKNRPGTGSQRVGEAAVVGHVGVDPRDVLAEARAPDDVGDIEDATVVEHRPAVLHAHDPRVGAVDACRLQVLALDPQQRPAAGADLRPDLAAERRLDREHAIGQEPRDGQNEPRDAALDVERHLAMHATRQHGRMRRGDLEGDVGARVAAAHDERRPRLKLRRVAVLVRVQLDDRRVEVARELRDDRLLERPRGDDDAVGRRSGARRPARSSARRRGARCRR